jgi:hypothetical protein
LWNRRHILHGLPETGSIAYAMRYKELMVAGLCRPVLPWLFCRGEAFTNPVIKAPPSGSNAEHPPA